MRQFLLGTVQRNYLKTITSECKVSIPLRYGTTKTHSRIRDIISIGCQFLLGTVQQKSLKNMVYTTEYVSIPLRYSTTGNKKDVEKVQVGLIRKCQFLLGTVQHNDNRSRKRNNK